jgi:3-dehydroquinate dehydratase-2
MTAVDRPAPVALERLPDHVALVTPALIINPAGFSFGCVPVFDALKLIRKPLVEVHITNIHQRPAPYTHSAVSQVAGTVICGAGAFGYLLAVRAVAEALRVAREGG